MLSKISSTNHYKLILIQIALILNGTKAPQYAHFKNTSARYYLRDMKSTLD